MREPASVFLLLGVLCATPLAAQQRGGGDEALRWPSAWSVPTDAVSAGQERRLPIYDDAGEPIAFAEVATLIDPSGAKGAFWGGLLGWTLGSLIGAGIAPLDCSEVTGGRRYYCSPRQDALNTALPLGIGITALFAGAWIGWGQDVVTWDEALAKVRYQRRITR